MSFCGKRAIALPGTYFHLTGQITLTCATMSYPVPENETARVKGLRDLGILDTPAEERFDRITRFANQLLGTPISLISLIDTDRQWFKSAQGLDIRETSRESSFCAHAIIQEKTFFVEDATKDDRFKDNPLVTGSPNIRMYAGHPIETESGLRIGTMCVIDRQPRQLNERETAILQNLAEWVKTELRNLELEKTVRLLEAKASLSFQKTLSQEKLYEFFNGLTLIDPDLRLPNTVYLNLYLTQEIARMRFSPFEIAVLAVGIDDMIKYEHTYGAPAAMAGLRAIAEVVGDYPKWPRGMTFRYGRDRLIVVLPQKNREQAVDVAEKIKDAIHQVFQKNREKLSAEMTVSFGISSMPAAAGTTDRLLTKAIEALDLGQRQGKSRIKYADFT